MLDREEFERIFALTSRRGVWLMTDECDHRFVYDDKPYSIAATKGAKDTVLVAVAFWEDLCDDRMAHRVWA